MPTFSARSAAVLADAHPDLQRLFNEVVKYVDCTILESHRGQERQVEMFETGRSKVTWPFSKHNTIPSVAVDVAFYPVEWENWKKWYFFGGFVKGMAGAMGIQVRWGGDWNSNNVFTDQQFHDMPHFELLNPRPVDTIRQV